MPAGGGGKAPPVDPTTLSKDELVGELTALRTKFADWKARAKTGVDTLREQLDAKVAETDAERAQAKQRDAEHAAEVEDLRAQLAEARLRAIEEKAVPAPADEDTQLLTDAQSTVAALEGQLATLQASLEAAREELGAVEGERDALRDAIVVAERERGLQLEATVARHAAELETLGASKEDDIAAAVAAEQDLAACVIHAMSSKCVVLRSAAIDGHKMVYALAHQGAHAIEAAKSQATAAASAEAASAKKQLDSVRAEFDRYKAQSSKALKLTTSGSDGMQRQLAAAQAAEHKALATAQECRERVATKDQTIAAIEDRFEAAMRDLAAAQRRCEELAEERDDFRRAVENALLERRQQQQQQQGQAGGDDFGPSVAPGPDGAALLRSVSRQRDGSADRDTPGTGDTSEAEDALRAAVAKANEVAEVRLRDELEAAAAAHQEELQQQEAEVMFLRVKVAQLQAKHGEAAHKGAAGDDDDAYVNTLRSQAADARTDAERLRVERDQLSAQVRRLHAQLDASQRGGTSSSRFADPNGPEGAADEFDANQALAQMPPDELRRQLLRKSEQLFDANQQVVQLRASLRSAASRGGGGGPLGGSGAGGAHQRGGGGGADSDQQQRYLRAVLINFFTAPRAEVRAGLVPVLATLLQLNTDELRNVYRANPDWIS